MHWPSYLADRGDADGLRQRADAGYESAARRLGPLLTSRAKVGDEAAAKSWRSGRMPATFTRITAWPGWPNGLVETVDVERLRQLADAGNEVAAKSLAALLVERGDVEGLRQRADVGDEYAARLLADLLAKRGDVEGLRQRTGQGDRSAAKTSCCAVGRAW